MPIYTTEGYQITQGVCKSGHFPSSNTHAHSIHFTDFLYKIPSMRAFNSPLSCRINSECIHDRVSPQSAMFLRGSKLHGSTLLAVCAGNSPVNGEFPSQRPVMRNFDVSFDLRQNKRLSKQSWGWWFETPSCSLWRHCNVYTELTWQW